MSLDPYIILGSAIVGFLVGMTGAGGGALMTPMLILFFGIKPSTAISSDLVAAVLMRPVGAVVHMAKKTVNYSLVGWMVLGWVPAALFGAYALHLLGNSNGAEHNVQVILGVALLLGAGAMVLRYGLDRRSGHRRQGLIDELVVRPLPTVAIGVVGGFVVGMTSVGSGLLMIVLLLFLYPVLGANQLVGTDLTQAVPLTVAAALGVLAFGHISFAVTASIVVGSVPAVLVGSLISSRAPIASSGRSSRSSSSRRASSTSASARPLWVGSSAPCCWRPQWSGGLRAPRPGRRRCSRRAPVRRAAARGRVTADVDRTGPSRDEACAQMW